MTPKVCATCGTNLVEAESFGMCDQCLRHEVRGGNKLVAMVVVFVITFFVVGVVVLVLAIR